MKAGIIVLGAHRSGTSLIAELVHAWGASPGFDVCPTRSFNECAIGQAAQPTRYLSHSRGAWANWWNPRGLWEYTPLVTFDRQLLSSIGSTWYLPPSEEDDASLIALGGTSCWADLARGLLDNMDSLGKAWFWKDPRLCVLLPFWLPIWGDGVSYVICSRNPLDVAMSLRERDGIPLQIGLKIWQRYMVGIAHGTQGVRSSIVVSYASMLKDPAAQCRRLACFLEAEHGSGVADGEAAVGRMQRVVDTALNRARGYRRRGDTIEPSATAEDQFQWFEGQSALSSRHMLPEPSWFQMPNGWRQEIATAADRFSTPW